MTQKAVTKRARSIRYTKTDIVTIALFTLVMTAFLVIVLYPLLYVISCSFSGGAMLGGGLSLIPKNVTLEGYKAVFEYKYIWTGYRNSLVYTVLGTAIAMVVTILCAYPLSRRDFKNGRIVMGMAIFTMYFTGGLIPTYLWMRDLRMLDTMWVLVLPGALSVYNMIVMRTFFSTQIPDELLEASQIDGCGEWRFLLQIVLPLSEPILAVIGMYYAVALWNGYFNAMVYIQTSSKLPLANVLREVLVMNMSTNLQANVAINSEVEALLEKRAEVMRYSLIIVSSVPVMLLYPFVQKHFVKGVMIGAVKG